MATADRRLSWIPRAGEEPRSFRWSARDLRSLESRGFLRGRHVELIRGRILERRPLSPACATSIELVADALRPEFQAGLYVRQQGPLSFGKWSLPCPDLSVVSGRPRDYLRGFPATAPLVIEIAASSLRFDRTVKARLYARAGIADYWIVNLVDRQLEIHRDPALDPDRKGRFRYSNVTIIPADGHASPLAKPEARIAVADMLP